MYYYDLKREKSSIAFCVVMSVVTCGIFGIYWYYCIARAYYNSNTPSRVDTSPGMVILLNIITCGIYGHYMFYKWGKQTPELFYQYNRYGEDRSVLYLVLSLLDYLTGGITGLIAMCLIQSDINQL
ncbi:DUF4234 domain-containing protein, partial [Ruminococcaceae bacterium OttesenSCG-928-D13]|nr:DUF4234 domain-containing protein [Ruminococcaceae bacterium OttesenSCG-928-D13]